MKQKETAAHAAALVTVLIWGTTFISTKLLLTDFTPIEILLLRFTLGFLALLAAYPRPLGKAGAKRELTFAAAGLCGIALYYLLENIALTDTSASNVGVILSTAPFFTAILSRLFGAERDRLSVGFFIGFAAAMAGIALLSFGGSGVELHPLGDLLALGAAVVWAVYSLLTRRIAGFGLPLLATTRRVFAYGLIFLLPTLPFFPFGEGAARFADPIDLANLLFLGLGASALCFVTWSFAVGRLGAVKTSVYIYTVPVITVAASILVLGETLTPTSALGTGLTIAGLLISEIKPKGRERKNGK
ncbi:MAG: DMT family transporter [Bacteroides sp.]|nr:DMT family transporter [Eubacterium sp.]MCM1418001.1 DMT family transporter [Roseburia sp.]MCM1462176.1 DMT family transporter [Bacteroides sp.]